MTPFEQANADPESTARFLNDLLAKWRAGVPEIRDAFPYSNEEEAALHMARIMEEESNHPIFRNDTYTVSVRHYGENINLCHLSIKRNDRKPIHDWRDLQQIKNELCGPEIEAVELYPAESRRVDSANQYHLWAVMRPGYRFPFGFTERSVSDLSVGGSLNRPIGKEVDRGSSH